LKLGKSVRSPNGANRVREFVRAVLADFSTRKRLLDASIASKLPILLLCVAVLVAGILIAAYLL